MPLSLEQYKLHQGDQKIIQQLMKQQLPQAEDSKQEIQGGGSRSASPSLNPSSEIPPEGAALRLEPPVGFTKSEALRLDPPQSVSFMKSGALVPLGL